MGSLALHKSGVWRIRLRFGGHQFYRSLETLDEHEAIEEKAKIERTIRLVRQGDKDLPPDATADQVWRFLRSGGRVIGEPEIAAGIGLAAAIDRYFADIPRGAKDDSSVYTERIHANHLKRILGTRRPLQSIGVTELQDYANQRTKSVEPYTVRKELGTFHQIWNHAKVRGWVSGESAKRYVRLPKSPEKPPFRTFEEIYEAVENGADDEMWESLFLRESEVLELLDYAREHGSQPFVYPMVCFAGLTGARRSEVIRSELTDWNLDRGVVLIREKKRVRSASGSFRRVDVADRLVRIMREWFATHPGGRYTICAEPDRPLTNDMASGYLRRMLRKSEKWCRVHGFHVLRHSFASICAMNGIHQSVIDGWMGHQTEAMRERYRHLFPEETRAAVSVVFNGD